MNMTRVVLAALAATVVDGFYGFVVYGNALAGRFAAFPGVFRSAEDGPAALPLMFESLLELIGGDQALFNKNFAKPGRHI